MRHLVLVRVVALLACAAQNAESAPRQVADLDRNGFLAPPAGTAPELTSVAGARFLDLVPDSRREVCRIVLEHYARTTRGLYRLQVVDGRGQKVISCEL